MRPSYEQFVAALRDPQQRASIGLVIGDEDAASLLSRADWATAYFEKWIGMFPAEPVVVAGVAAAPAAVAAAPAAVVAAPPAAQPFVAPATTPVITPAPLVAPAPAVATAPPATTGYLGDPPPQFTGIRSSSSLAFAAEPMWAPNALGGNPIRRRMPRAGRIAIIAGATVAGLVLIGGIGLAVSHVLTPSVVASRTTGTTTSDSGTTGSGTTGTSAVGKYGLSAQEYELMEASIAPFNESLEGEVAAGATDAQIRSAADAMEAQVAKTCTDAASVNGWNDSSFKIAFLAGFEAKTKATPAQAERVFAALQDYCLTK